MAGYAKLHHAFWRDPEIRSWTQSERFLAVYLLTCPHRTSEGLFYLPLIYAAHDLGWEPDDLAKGYAALAERGFCAYDRATETVLLPKALKWECPRGPKQLAGAANRLSDVPPTPLFGQFLELASEWCPDLLPHLAERGITPSRYPIDTVSDTVSEQDSYPSDCSSSSSSSTSSSSSNSKPLASSPEPLTLIEEAVGASEEASGPPEPDFDDFWQPYPRHPESGKPGGGGPKTTARKAWDKLNRRERYEALVAVVHYAEFINRPSTTQRPCAASTWLNQRRWEDWRDPADPARPAQTTRGAELSTYVAAMRRRAAELRGEP